MAWRCGPWWPPWARPARSPAPPICRPRQRPVSPWGPRRRRTRAGGAFAAIRGGVAQPLWRISTSPTKGHELAARIAGEVEAEVLYDWAGGLVWVATTVAEGPTAAAAAARVRTAVRALGGHATLMRGSAQLRAAVGVFEPQEAGLAALTKRVKRGFH